jgi:hypothetical protein
MNTVSYSSLWAVFVVRPSPTLAKIGSFASLPVGWDYGNGVPASVSTVSLARDLYYELTQLGFTRTEAFPGTDGAIQLTAYEGDLQHIIVIVRPSGEISLTHKINGLRTWPSIVAADRNTATIKTILREIARDKWNIFVSSTPSSLTTSGGVTQRLPLQTMRMTEAQP